VSIMFQVSFFIGFALGYLGLAVAKGDLPSPKALVKSFESKSEDEGQYINYKSDGTVEQHDTKAGDLYDGCIPSRGTNNNWSNPDRAWTDADREHVSKIIHDTEYASKDLASEQISGELQLVDEKDLVKSDGDDSDDSDDKDLFPVEVSAATFVKGVAGGKNIQSFVFDPFTKKFCWNFTLEEVDIADYLGKKNFDSIMEESNYNANGWIQSRYYYSQKTDTYVRVEAGRW